MSIPELDRAREIVRRLLILGRQTRGHRRIRPGCQCVWCEARRFVEVGIPPEAQRREPIKCPHPGRRKPCPSDCEHLRAPRCTLNDVRAPASRTPCDDHRPDGPDPHPDCRCAEIDRLCNQPNRPASRTEETRVRCRYCGRDVPPTAAMFDTVNGWLCVASAGCKAAAPASRTEEAPGVATMLRVADEALARLAAPAARETRGPLGPCCCDEVGGSCAQCRPESASGVGSKGALSGPGEGGTGS